MLRQQIKMASQIGVGGIETEAQPRVGEGLPYRFQIIGTPGVFNGKRHFMFLSEGDQVFHALQQAFARRRNVIAFAEVDHEIKDPLFGDFANGITDQEKMLLTNGAVVAPEKILMDIGDMGVKDFQTGLTGHPHHFPAGIGIGALVIFPPEHQAVKAGFIDPFQPTAKITEIPAPAEHTRFFLHHFFSFPVSIMPYFIRIRSSFSIIGLASTMRKINVPTA